MSVAVATSASEMGVVAAETIREITAKAVAGANIATFAEGTPPLSWQSLAEAGWDRIGIPDPDNDITLRDLVEVAMAWGESGIPLPLVESIIAKRHSEAAADYDGPVTIAFPSRILPDGMSLIPYGALSGVGIATALGGGGAVQPVPAGERDLFDLTAKSIEAPFQTKFSATAAGEVAVMIAAEATGSARRLLDEAVAYAKERRQFGQPIGSFQAVKHRLADALIDVQLAETALVWASVHQEESYRGAQFAVDRSIAVAEGALQIHGGIGFTWEMGLHFRLRHIVRARGLIDGLRSTRS